MKTWRSAAALLAMVACADTKQPSGYLVLALNTGDLVLPKDTGTVGLYLTQIDEGGRVRALPAMEQTVTLDERGVATVKFPAQLVVESAGKPARVRSRFVAFRADTRDVLTMRESRSAVPTDGSGLVRLSLFFFNGGNVQDTRAGEPLHELQLGGALELAQDESGGVDPFARFVSLCDGAPAPEGRTAGDDGRCVALDVEPEAIARDAALPGSSATEICFDLAQAFGRGGVADNDVPTLTVTPLVADGACRIELPGTFDPGRLNVAFSSATGFDVPWTDASTVQLRPLASGLAFRQEGNVLVAPTRVCELLSGAQLAFSQRAPAWNGRDPICAPWTVGKASPGYDGGAPTLPDAAPAPGSNAYSVDAQGAFHQIAARDGVVALSFVDPNMAGGPEALLRVEPAAFELGGTAATSAPLRVPSASQIYAMTVAGNTEIYLSDRSNLSLVPRDGGAMQPLVRSTDAGTPQVPTPVMMAGKPYAVWANRFTGAVFEIGAFVDATTLGAPVSTLASEPMTEMLPRLRSVAADRFVVPNAIEPKYLTGRFSEGAPILSGEQQLPDVNYSIVDATRVGQGLFGFYRRSAADGGVDYVALDYDNPSQIHPMQPTLSNEQSAVPTPDGFCAVYRDADAATMSVVCRTLAELTTNAAGTSLLRAAFHASIDVDDTYLYLAHTCALNGPVQVQRLALSALTPGAVKNPCP